MTRKSGSLFSGTAALDMAASEVFDVEPAWFCDIDPAASALLAHHYPGIPNLGDITAVGWDQVEQVWMLTGGFPCTDLSLAGKQEGLKPGTRSGLWTQFAYAISKLRPEVVLIENVRGLASAEAHSDLEPCPWCVGDQRDEPVLRAFGAVLGDLADRGYDAVWCGLPASDVGACHARFRFFVLAFARDAEVRGWHVEPDAQRRGEPAGQARGSGLTLADANGHERSRQPDQRPRGATASWSGDELVADSDGVAVREQPEPITGRSSQALTEQPGADTESPAYADRGGLLGDQERDLGSEGGLEPSQRDDASGRVLDWAQYGPAIRRWERILGRPAPFPTAVGGRGGRVLNPALPEFMMGLPEGWITAVPGLTRAQQLKLAGNGVVTQQAIAAFRYLASVLNQETRAAA